MNQLFFLVGLGRTSTAHASILITMMPVIALMLAALAGQERITAGKMLGLALAISGVGVLQTGSGRGGEATLLGDAFIVLAALAFAAFTVVGKTATVRHGSLTVNTFAYAGGALVFSPILALEASRFPFSGVSMAAWASLLYMAVFPSVVCYMIYYYALGWLPPSRLLAFSYLQPPLATLLSAALLGESVSSAVAAGGALVLGGVFLTERGKG